MRTPSATQARITRDVLAMLACLLPIAAVAYLYAFAPSSPPEPTYTLTGITEAGERYDLDTGLTFSDCDPQSLQYDMRFTHRVCLPEHG